MIHCINLPHRTDRRANMEKEFAEQGITEYRIWEGQVDKRYPFIGIARSHKRIVMEAKMNGWPEVTICEDDVTFTDPKSYEYFLKNKPEDFDIYLSGIFDGRVDPATKKVHTFSGLTLYIIKSKFYNTFLSVTDMGNIDRNLSGLGDYKVCWPISTSQLGGKSDNTGRMAEKGYASKLAAYKIYKSDASSEI